MTTKITVDAHAGWPVEVAIYDFNENTPSSVDVVQPGTIRDFHIHSTRHLVIREKVKTTQ